MLATDSLRTSAGLYRLERVYRSLKAVPREVWPSPDIPGPKCGKRANIHGNPLDARQKLCRQASCDLGFQEYPRGPLRPIVVAYDPGTLIPYARFVTDCSNL
jgi:hypothetical protein